MDDSKLTPEEQKTWDIMTDGCLHEELTFGSGDYFIFCSKCNRTWIIDERDGKMSNIGRASGLSGEKRIKK